MTITTAWLVAAIVSAIAEILSPRFGYVLVSAAALAGALAAGLGLPVAPQLVLFVVVLLASLALVRPRLLAKLGAKGVPSRTQALVGKAGVVTEAIDPVIGTGRITVAGQDWAARSVAPVPVGTTVRVDDADGIVLHVSPS